jgi:hypothetical protein
MTRSTSTSTTRLARRTAVGLIALGLLLSGCSAGSATEPTSPAPTATPTPTLEPDAIAAEIAATFPTEAEWLAEYESAKWCTAEIAGLNSCGNDVIIPNTVSNGFNLRDGVTEVTAAAVVLHVAEFASAEEAEKYADESKAADAPYAGNFDIPMNAETNASGARGTGTLVDFGRNGWAGYRMTQVSEATGYDGAAFGPATSTTSITMTDGPLRFSLAVYSASAEPGVADAEVAGWLDRVFGPEESD